MPSGGIPKHLDRDASIYQMHEQRMRPCDIARLLGMKPTRVSEIINRERNRRIRARVA